MPIELSLLNKFLGVAATGSFSRAATLLQTTQSAVSKGITQLEAGLGSRLFDRTGRGATLTESGRELLPRAESLVAEAQALHCWMAGRRDVVSGPVRLALQPGVSWPLLEAVWAKQRRDYPGIALQVAEGTTHQIEQWLSDGRCDVGVLSRESSAAVAESWPLFSTPLLLVAAPGSRHTQSPTVAFDALAGIDLVIATAHNGGRVRVEEEARRRGMQLRIALEVDSLFLNKRVVASSALCMVAAWPAVSVEVLRGELSQSRLVEPELRQTYYLAIGRRRHATSAIRCVAELVRGFVPSTDWGLSQVTGRV